MVPSATLRELATGSQHHFLVVGSNAREHAIARKLKESHLCASLSCFAANNNPGIKTVCDNFSTGNITDGAAVAEFARAHKITIAVVGPEGPLEAGVSDALWAIGVRCVGPKQKLAQLESSKAFTRNLLINNGIGACPKYLVARTLDECARFFKSLPPLMYVVKADGLCGGKGVKVAGEHLMSDAESLEFCAELFAEGGSEARVVLEEKLVGQEFSLMSFCDGEFCAHIPPIQDHKRAHEGDKGPNTGGMGTYSGPNGTLPFLSLADLEHAQAINEAVGRSLRRTCGEPYKGILYGGFMATARGVYVIEYNARLGDPEAMNALALLETDFGEICEAVCEGTLRAVKPIFSKLASCCVYAVPDGYPAAGVKGSKIDLSALTDA
ncbi:Phosphoribosylamine-glycine ligase, partial [Pavlovales sp. CCMP2436]